MARRRAYNAASLFKINVLATIFKKPREQAPEKPVDESLLQHFDFEQPHIIQTIPFEQKAV